MYFFLSQMNNHGGEYPFTFVGLNSGKTAVIKDAAAYGFILIHGKGTCGEWEIETPALIHYGELTNDEFFVTEKAATEGVVINNTSSSEELVMLKHFA